MPNPVVHFEIHGKDGSALQSFYRDLYGWNIDANNEWNYGMVVTGGEGGINGGIATDEMGGNRVTIYTAVDDLQAYLDKAISLGAEMMMPPTDMGTVQIAIFRDPAGNVAGLVKDDPSQR